MRHAADPRLGFLIEVVDDYGDHLVNVLVLLMEIDVGCAFDRHAFHGPAL